MNLHKPNNLAIRPPGYLAIWAWVGVAGLILSVVGCKSTDNKKNEDPLFGVKQPQVNPVPPTTGANGPQSHGVPPIPGNTSAGSNAALASLPGARQLSINEQLPPGATAPPGSTVPNVQPIPREAPANPALLTTGSWTQQTPAITPNLPPAPADNFIDPQFALLQARGATSKIVDPDAEGVHLKVFVPNRADPGTVRIYEAKGRDYPAAAQAVLQQIDAAR